MRSASRSRCQEQSLFRRALEASHGKARRMQVHALPRRYVGCSRDRRVVDGLDDVPFRETKITCPRARAYPRDTHADHTAVPKKRHTLHTRRIPGNQVTGCRQQWGGCTDSGRGAVRADDAREHGNRLASVRHDERVHFVATGNVEFDGFLPPAHRIQTCLTIAFAARKAVALRMRRITTRDHDAGIRTIGTHQQRHLEGRERRANRRLRVSGLEHVAFRRRRMDAMDESQDLGQGRSLPGRGRGLIERRYGKRQLA